MMKLFTIGLAITLACAGAQAQVDSSPVTSGPGGLGSPSGLDEIVRLVQAGIQDNVVISYVASSGVPFGLTADKIIYLQNQGVSADVIKAMLAHDGVTSNVNTPVVTPDPNVPIPTNPTDASPVTPPDPPAPYTTIANPDTSYFYNTLSPYGTWINLDSFGWCWQPSSAITVPGWRPYSDNGHWIYTSNGWYWQSDYVWGWAPFHYGRWQYRDTLGWVWFPDRTWGPGWVTWRVNGEYCGWAPLPYRAEFSPQYGYRFNGVRVSADYTFDLPTRAFTFIAIRDFGQPNYAVCRLNRDQTGGVFRGAAVMNNFQVARGNEIINRGIPKEQVEARTHAPVKTLAVREQAPGAPIEAKTVANGAVYRRQATAPREPVMVTGRRVDDQSRVPATGTVPARQSPVTYTKEPVGFTPNTSGNGASYPQKNDNGMTGYRPATFQATTPGGVQPGFVPVNNLVDGPGNPIHTNPQQGQNQQFYHPKTFQPSTGQTRAIPTSSGMSSSSGRTGGSTGAASANGTSTNPSINR